MSSEDVLSFLERRIKELHEARQKGVKRDVLHLLEHTLMVNEMIYINQLKKFGKNYVQSSSSEVQ